MVGWRQIAFKPASGCAVKGQTKMKKRILSFGLLVVLSGLVISARSQTFSETQLTQQGREAYRLLLVANRFEDKAVGYAGEESKFVTAYNVLLKESAGDGAFKSLLDKAPLAGQLYALCGVYFKDRVFFNSGIGKYKNSQQEVDTLQGCLGGRSPVASLIEAYQPMVIDPNRPKESLSEYMELNSKMWDDWEKRKPKNKKVTRPVGYQLDISNGGYSVWFLNEH